MRTPWPHAPVHRLGEGGVFLVTAGTYRKVPFFQGNDRLKVLHDGLLRYAAKFEWQLEAWAVFPNHYHFVGRSPKSDEDATSLSKLLAEFHQRSASWVNGEDSTDGRRVWHNFWETRLTYENSYFAHLNYVHQNAVKHGIVHGANQYPWCSAAWFERTAEKSQVATIYSFAIDQLKVLDDY